MRTRTTTGDTWIEVGPVTGDREFDIDFWQAQTAEARFAAAWDLVVLAHEMK